MPVDAVKGRCLRERVLRRNTSGIRMEIAFIVDPLDSLEADKGSSISLLGAAALRGHRVDAFEQTDLSWREGQVVANALRRTVHADNTHWHDTGTAENRRTAVTRARMIFRASQGNRT